MHPGQIRRDGVSLDTQTRNYVIYWLEYFGLRQKIQEELNSPSKWHSVIFADIICACMVAIQGETYIDTPN